LSIIIHGTAAPLLSGFLPLFFLVNGQALLEQFDADIICFQEHKLQRKDITFEMANIPGFDGYYSFSKVKKGYSGV
jgi:exonuclease III